MTEPGSFEAYFAWEEEQQKRVQAALAPEQRALTWGDHFIRFWSDRMNGDILVIFGRIYTWEEMVAVEDEETLAVIKRQEDRFLYAWCSSVIEEGEPGSVNRWDMWPITSSQYHQAEEAGWNPHHPNVIGWAKQAGYDLMTKRGTFTDAPRPEGWEFA